MRQLLLLLVCGAITLGPSPRCSAQNVTGYGTIPQPFLFLLREPAVHDDLELTPEQRRRLIEINHSFDGVLLSSRNTTPEQMREKTAAVMLETREQVTELLSAKQRNRMAQIAYRLRGLSFVLMPDAAEELQLSSRQRSEIESIVKETLETINSARSKTYQGKEAHEKAQQVFADARKNEQQVILGALDDEQKRTLLTLVGRYFDPRRLGHVSFKAPELSKGDEWINSKALQLADLRGKVVALHFWAFG